MVVWAATLHTNLDLRPTNFFLGLLSCKAKLFRFVAPQFTIFQANYAKPDNFQAYWHSFSHFLSIDYRSQCHFAPQTFPEKLRPCWEPLDTPETLLVTCSGRRCTYLKNKTNTFRKLNKFVCSQNHQRRTLFHHLYL